MRASAWILLSTVLGCGGGNTGGGGGCGDPDGDGVLGLACGGLDCDDENAAIAPGLDDLPGDGLDRNCDGIDGMDADGDHHGAVGAGGEDCDDADPTRYPGAPDTEDGVDQNCDGVDGIDADGDGHASVATGGDDCDDTSADRSPDAEDLVGDEFDQNCDGADGVDADGDGHATVESGGDDCDDTDPTRYGVAEDGFGNGVDENCDGADGVDADGDGFGSVESGGPDCNDADPLRNPDAVDLVGDEYDQNCDGADGVDADGDVHATIESGGDDCDDADPTRHGGALDTVGDGLDQNCDGLDGVDVDGDGWASEASGGDDCDDDAATVHPGRPDGETEWEDVARERDGWSAIALDGTGHLDAVYMDFDSHVRWATNQSGAWEVETVDDMGIAGWTISLVLDADGAAHVAYSEANQAEAIYLTNESGAWVREVVDSDGVTDVSLALDVDGNPVLLYSYWVSWVDRGLRMASHTDGAWDVEVVANGSLYRPDHVVDADGFVHAIVGPDYYTNASGAWVATPLPRVGGGVIAQDPDGFLHVIAGGVGGTVHSTNETGVWTTEDVAAVDPTGLGIGVDANGTVYAVWQDWNLGDPDLWYATNLDGEWVATAIDTEGATGYGRSIAVEADGTAHVLHETFSGGEMIRHGVVTPQNGIDDDCDGVAW